MEKVLACDLDGTLFYPSRIKHCIPRKNRIFLRKWIDAGNRLVLVTSRGPDFCNRLKEEIQRPFDVLACISSHVTINGEVVKDVTISRNDLIRALDTIQKKYKPIAMLITTKEYPLVIRNNSVASKILALFYKLYWLFQFKRRETFVLNNKVFDTEVKKGGIYKAIMFYGFARSNKKMSKQINKELREEFPDIEFSWTRVVNELTPKNCNKGEGLKFYCNYLKIPSSNVYVVGDSGNDITMFNLYHENSYVMAKAYPSVKKYAKHVVRRVYKLDELLLKKENKDE